jgi:anhydro-N-acetylmuramic acid kinase
VIVVGMLSGTSADGLDVAVCEIEVGPTTTLAVRRHEAVPWPDGLQDRLLAVLPPATTTVGEIAALDHAVGQAAAAAAGGHDADLVAWLGQTVFHGISGGRATGGLQLGQPAWIAEATGLPVVSDLRSTDIAAGGHGAPLASTLDALWLAGDAAERSSTRRGGPDTRIALNLGGIANVTVVAPTAPSPREGNPRTTRALGSSPHVTAFDTGPANCWLDVVAQRTTGVAYDVDGALAAGGVVDDGLLRHLLTEPYYAAPPPKTTGRERFTATALDAAVAHAAPGIAAPDLAATLVALTARTVADACRAHGAVEVVGSGGGMANPTLRAALAAELAPVPLVSADDHGLPSDAKEAVLTALLGALTWHGVPGVLPGATGSTTPRVLGRISSGHRPLRLPEPVRAVNGLDIR